MKTLLSKFVVYLFLIIVVTTLLCVFANWFVPTKYKHTIQKYCAEYDLSPSLVFALINCESQFDKNAKSNAGALGLMQIMPSTAKHLAQQKGIEDFDLFCVEDNLNLGCFYLKQLVQKYQNEKTALCAYNAGPKNVDDWLLNTNFSKDNHTLFEIPFEETKNYVRKINIFRTFYINIFNL